MSKNVPKLRFKEFSNDWSEANLDKLSSIIMGQSPPSSAYNEEKIGYPLVQGNADIYKRRTRPRVYTKKLTKKCEIGDIIMSVRAPVGTVAISEHIACIGRGVCAIRAYQCQNFLYQLLLKQEGDWGLLSQGSTFEAVSGKDIKSLSVKVPGIQEQEKMADFLSAIDSRITNQSSKLDSLQELKKGVMQKIFSQEIRFKREDGGEYPDWEEAKISEMYDFYPTNSLSREKLTQNSSSQVMNIHYGDIHTQFSSILDVSKYSIPFIKSEYLNVGNYQTGLEGDVFIADASEDYNDIGKATELINRNGHKIVGGLHVLHLRDKFKKHVNGFRGYLFNSNLVRSQIKTLAVGSKVLGISKPNMGSVQLVIPCNEEQQKIADFLSTLDSKISLESQILETLQTLKKALLQQMFV